MTPPKAFLPMILRSRLQVFRRWATFNFLTLASRLLA